MNRCDSEIRSISMAIASTARRLVRILDGLPHLLPHLIARRVGGGSG